MSKVRGGITIVEPPTGEVWPAVVCLCGKTLARLRDCGEAGVAVMIVDRHGGVPRYQAENLNAMVFGAQGGQTRLHSIATLDRRRRAQNGGYPPQSYEFTCGKRCSAPPTLVTVARLERATSEAVQERRDVLIGVHI